MDTIPPTGYRSYDPDPQTATGIQALTTDQGGNVYEALVSAVIMRLTGRAHARRMRPAICLDLYHSPGTDVFLSQFRTAWETALFVKSSKHSVRNWGHFLTLM